MLVLTCRVGGTLRVGDDICVTFERRMRDRVAVWVMTPAGVNLFLDRACLQPSILPSGSQSYLFSLLGIRRFRVGSIEVGVWLPGEVVALASDCDEFIHVGIHAFEPIRIGYEEKNLTIPNRPGGEDANPTSYWH